MFEIKFENHITKKLIFLDPVMCIYIHNYENAKLWPPYICIDFLYSLQSNDSAGHLGGAWTSWRRQLAPRLALLNGFGFGIWYVNVKGSENDQKSKKVTIESGKATGEVRMQYYLYLLYIYIYICNYFFSMNTTSIY